MLELYDKLGLFNIRESRHLERTDRNKSNKQSEEMYYIKKRSHNETMHLFIKDV